MKTTKWKTLLAASMAGLTLLSSAPLQAFATETQGNNSGLVMDDTSNVINGLTDAHMWSNDNGASWTRGKENQVFKGTQKVIVANYDEQIASAQTWSAKSYAGGSLVIYKNALWTNSYWAEANQAPGSAPMWTKVKDVPAGIATFNFNKFTGAAADDYQKVQAETVQNQKKVIGYFANWQGYKTDYEPNNADYNYSQGVLDGKGYDPVDVPFDKITHVNYGFMIIDPKTGKLTSNDAWADFDDTVSGGGKNYIGQITDMADENDVAAMVSIGGWNNSVNDMAFDIVTKTPEKMDAFTDEAVKFMLDHNFDGIDIDWEYPDNADRQTKFIALMKQLREKLTVAGKENDTYYQLSIAVTASHEKMEFIAPETVNEYVDNFNVMTYDFRGGFDTQTGHHSGLYATETDKDQKFNVSSAMKEYSETYNIPKNKLMVGMSYYSRGFANVESGELGAASSGAPVGGTWDDPYQPAGLKPWWQIKDLEAQANEDPNDSLVAKWDDQAKAPYIYDADAKEFYSYDNIQSIQEKVNWTIKNEYGGAIVWELGYDTTDAELGSIVKNVLTAEPTDPPVEESDLLGIRLDQRERKTYMNLNLTPEQYNSKTRYMVYLDGKYAFETYNGKCYYSHIDKSSTTEDKTVIEKGFAGKAQQKMEVYIVAGEPGQSTNDKKLVDTMTLDKDIDLGIDEVSNAVKNITYNKKSIYIDIDRKAYEGNNRMMVYRNNNYLAEVFASKIYYSALVKKTNDTVQIRVDSPVESGDIIEVRLSSGLPSHVSDTLKSLMTVTVK
ncbi:glycosyl hydrolase family 18 protein [Enterococcus sp. DIV0660C]|uniref:glycosyl hydrolase family 18 protein n=1 Tax=Enterococcus sp. DIV0660C TaxID=2230880 RepID=UPI001A8DEFA7|nr:glycosyl hydrolase family 18 protein [Enterococcus sp. DIV0660C]MBO0432056.1 hypothetical protein [Enterococcus sp. DIV0660C]